LEQVIEAPLFSPAMAWTKWSDKWLPLGHTIQSYGLKAIDKASILTAVTTHLRTT